MKRKDKKQFIPREQKKLVEAIGALLLLAGKAGLEIEEVEDKEQSRAGLLITRKVRYRLKKKKK